MVYTPFLEFTATPQGSVQLLMIQKKTLPNCENQHPGLRIIAIWQIPKSGSMVQFKSSSRWVSDTCPSVVFGGATIFDGHTGFLFVAIFGGFGHVFFSEEKKRCCWNGLDMFRSRRRPRRNDRERLQMSQTSFDGKWPLPPPKLKFYKFFQVLVDKLSNLL